MQTQKTQTLEGPVYSTDKTAHTQLVYSETLPDWWGETDGHFSPSPLNGKLH